MDSKIVLKWLGHSCYKITKNGFTIVIDPFEPGSVPGLTDINEEANLVLCSHDHHDHGYTKAVKIIPNSQNPFIVTKIETYHDDSKGSLRGRNTIHIIESEGVRIAHFGDIGCELTNEQVPLLNGIDCALIPVGGHFTIGPEAAKELVDKIAAKLVIPMHYRSDNFGFDVIGTVQDYLDICGRWVKVDSDKMEITKQDRHYTAVLTYKN